MITTEEDNFKTGEIFYHYKNLKPYVILGFCKLQEKNIWIEAVLYSDFEAYKQAENKQEVEKFTRTLKEFKIKFKKLGEIKC